MHSSQQYHLTPYEGVKHLEMDGEYTSPMDLTEDFENDPLDT